MSKKTILLGLLLLFVIVPFVQAQEEQLITDLSYVDVGNRISMRFISNVDAVELNITVDDEFEQYLFISIVEVVNFVIEKRYSNGFHNVDLLFYKGNRTQDFHFSYYVSVSNNNEAGVVRDVREESVRESIIQAEYTSKMNEVWLWVMLFVMFGSAFIVSYVNGMNKRKDFRGKVYLDSTTYFGRKTAKSKLKTMRPKLKKLALEFEAKGPYRPIRSVESDVKVSSLKRIVCDYCSHPNGLELVRCEYCDGILPMERG